VIASSISCFVIKLPLPLISVSLPFALSLILILVLPAAVLKNLLCSLKVLISFEIKAPIKSSTYVIIVVGV